MKCWNCGAENAPESQWCTSCMSWMTDTRDGENIKLASRESLTHLSCNIAKIVLLSALLALVVICIMTLVVGIYDLLTGHRMLAGIGEILWFAGFVLAFSPFLVGSRDSKRMVVYTYSPKRTRRPYGVFYKTIVIPLTQSMRLDSSVAKGRHSFIQFAAGIIVFGVGMYLAWT